MLLPQPQQRHHRMGVIDIDAHNLVHRRRRYYVRLEPC